MIENNEYCYLYHNYKKYGKLYHLSVKNENSDDIVMQWNTKNKSQAGVLKKFQWLNRMKKWEDRSNEWILESLNGKEEVAC